LWPRAVAHWQACEYFVALEVGTADLAEAARVGPGPAAIPGPLTAMPRGNLGNTGEACGVL